MYRSSSGRSSLSSSSRSKESGSSASRSSRSGTSTSSSTRGRSPCPSSPRGRRHRSPSSSRSSRRSPSPRRSSRRRSPGRRSRSPGRRSHSPGRHSHSPGRHSRSPGRRSRSPGRHSPSRHSESSVEQGLRITVGNDHYGIDIPERRRLSDRLGSPVDTLNDVDRDDLAEGPIFSRSLSRPRSLERYSSHEESPSSPFSMRHDEDYRSRDVFLHQSDYSMNYDHLQDLPREPDRDGELLRKSLYPLEERGRDTKRPRYDRDDRVLDVSIEPQGFLPGTRNYRKRSLSRSPSPTYLDEDFRELESARRKREEEELSRNLSRELSGSGYMIPGLTNPVQSSEPRYLYRPDEAPAMPKKSILKKRVDDPSVQPEVFSNSSASIKEPPLLSNRPSLPQRSCIAPFSSEVENFLKQFNKNAAAESANKESQGNMHDWRPYSGLQQNTFPFEQNFGSFLKQKEHHESTSEPTDRHSDFLLPHERASQDGSGFSRILGMMADSTSVQEKRRRSLPDIEDEEKFLYGDDDNDVNISPPSTQKLTTSGGQESVSQKVSSPTSPNPTVKLDTTEESKPEYEKIHDLLKTIGLDIGVAEIGKLAARTQERLHGKKPSHSPDHHSVVSHKPESREMRRSRSDTRSPESSQKRSLSPSGSYSSSKEKSSVPKSEHIKNKTVGQDNSAGTPERSVPPVSLIPSAPPSLPNLPPTPTAVSQYPVSRFSPFTANQLPQNYPTPPMPPPGYDAYGHYMAYAASGWPMYAPPQQADPTLSNVHGLVTLSMPPNPTRPNLRVIETVSTGKGTPEIKKDESVNLVQIPTTAPYSKLHPHQFSPQSSLRGTMERMSDEKNRASQKQKVIEEREKLKAEQEARQKKLQYLRTELDRLSKQQGEMLRKKRREKDGHKDPLLVEVNRLQENIVKEIAQLKIHAEAAEKKQSELDKVAQILGINVFEKSRKQSTDNKDFSEKNKSENAKSQEKTSSSIKESKTSNDKPKGRSPKPTESSQSSKQHFQLANIYDYYDTGNHWCKDCNTICGTMFDFFTHMHNKKHRQTLDPYNRPWASKSQTETKQDLTKRIDKIPVPAKGSEFLIPVTGYYCQLCHEFFGDQISAEQHVKSHPHNEKYKKHLDENPLYEERRNLDRQAGLSVLQETERRLKRKQCEKQKEDKDEKMAKVAKKEEPKGTKQLEEGGNENEISKKKDDCNGQKLGNKFKLRSDDKEAEKKKGKKEESPKESRQSSFGKFSWRKSERDEKNQGKDVVASREESTEEGKERENKSQSGKSNSKPIAIKLSGKTVIPHTSPWTPVVSTSSQAKIRPNLPVPIMVLRKNATATVSKPAPLNTFLSIKSSGATTKPLPVVKEGNPELVLPPDIISKAFGGEVVVLKGSQDNENMPEQAEGQEHERAMEHARALERTKTSVAKAQEQAMIVAKAQAKARELATIVKEQEVTRTAKINEQPQMFERPHRHHPLLPLPPGPLLPLAPPLPQPSPVLFPPPALLPTKPAAILADDMAPGVSEDDKNMLAMPMYPRPSPPPTVFRDHIKKLEKKNSCLAAGNAKDLYDIFYNNSGRSPADNKFVNSAASDKGKLNPNESETSTDMLADSKPSNNSSTQQSLQDVDNSSDVTKTPLGDGIPGTEEVNVEKMLTVCEENVETEFSIKGDSEKISVSDSQSMLKYRETSESNNLPANASVSFHNVDIRTAAPTELSSNPSEFESAVLAMQLPENSGSASFDNVSEKQSELHTAESKSSDDKQLVTQLSEDNVVPLEDLTKKPSELEAAELLTQLPESSIPPLDEISKNPSELETAQFKPSDNKEFVIQLSEGNVFPLEEASRYPAELESAESVVHLPESSVPPSNEACRNSSELDTAEFESDDDKLSTRLPGVNMPLLKEVSKKPSELETAEFQSDEELSTRLLFKSDYDDLSTRLSEDNMPVLKEVSKKQSEFETAEFKYSADKELAVQFPDHETDISKELVPMSNAGVTSVEDINQKLHYYQEMEVHNESKLKEIKSDLEMNTHVTSLGERDTEKEHLELAEHQLAISQRDPESQLFEMQIETHKEEGPTSTAEKQIDDSFELPISTCVSDMFIHNQVAWEPTDPPKMNEENPQVVMTDHGSFKESSLDLKLGSIGFDGLEAGMCDERPPTSEDPELRPLNSGKLNDFRMNNKEQVLVSSQPKIDEDFDVPKSGEMPDECLANVTMISIDSTLEKGKEISQHSSTCKVKDLQIQGNEHLDSISSTNYVKPSSGVELMFLKSGKQGPSESDLTDIEERDSAETENVNLSSIQPEIVQESLDALPTDFGVGHLAEETLNFTGMTPGVINTSTAGDFDLNSTYSELSFDQSANLTLNLNMENERDSSKSDEVKSTDSPRLKPDLEIQTIDFRLGDIEVEREPMGTLPSEILNEETVESPRLETVAPICLKSSNTNEMGIDQTGIEQEMIDFVALTSGDQEDKLCSLVANEVSPAETGMPLLEMQDVPPVTEVLLQTEYIKSRASDMSQLSCDGRNVESQAAECMESLLSSLKEASVEVGGSGDNELYIIKNEMQTSAGELSKSDEVESNDSRCEINSKLASELIESSAELFLIYTAFVSNIPSATLTSARTPVKKMEALDEAFNQKV